MANEDVVKFKGLSSEYKDTRGGGATIPSAVMGIVKNNADPTHSGRLEVYIKRMGAADPDKSSSWTTVNYLSPFFGYTPNTGNPDGHGEYVGNPQSYGFWATPPDIGTEVLCLFLNGDPNEGFYVGCIPKPGMTQMVPGIGAADTLVANSGEASSYGGATKLPVGELNNANSKQSNALDQTVQPRPIHSYQAAIYNKQGLLRDPDRGPISSSSMRESPSRVFGLSTPGRPIFQGGYDDSNVDAALSDPNVSNASLKVIGRTGGHTLVMDDGDILGRDQLFRLRTATGHTILMNDKAQTLFIIHANGQSYIELGKEGTIDMYSTNSVNIRTQGDLNLHADNNINMHAGKDFTLNAQNIQVESEKQTNMFAGTNFAQSVKGNYTTKVDGGLSLASSGEASVASASTTYINGPTAVNLNTGSSGLTPQAVTQKTKIKHTDTLYDKQKGFAAAPGKLESVVSRAPAHTPWENANMGVNVKTNLSADANFPAPASAPVKAANNSAPPAPANPTSAPVIATVPNTGASASLDKSSSNALTSQMAVNAATGPAADAVAQGAGTVTANGTTTAVMGATGLTPTQLAASGHIKPGMEVAIDAAVQSGKSLADAIPPTAWTGKDGVNSLEDYLKNTNAQVSASQTLLDKSKSALVEKGVLTGKESPTQSGGLILATASSGIGPVTDYLKKVGSSSVSSLTGTLNSALSSKLPPGMMNSLTGSVESLMAGGKLATGLADKVMSGLPSLSDSSPEGTAKGLFDKITASFKPLKAGVPFSLSATNAANEAEKLKDSASKEVSSATASAAAEASKQTGSSSIVSDVTKMISKAYDSVTASVSSTFNSVKTAFSGNSGATGVANLPGGSESVASVVDKNAPSSLPGLGPIKDTIAKISGAASGAISSVSEITAGLKDKMGSLPSLTSFAGKDLNTNDLAKLSGSINAVGTGDTQVPVIATGTNDVTALAEQSKTLLGNPKIPSIKI